MKNRPTKGGLVGLCTLAFFAGLQIQAASAQDAQAATQEAKPGKKHASVAQSPVAGKPARKRVYYYVDFRARTAQTYGHAFVWYGRTDRKEVDVAGLHPATDSVIPYLAGHIIPVLSETGASYGDLDEEYLTASYRVLMDESQAERVFAQIKHMRATTPLWNAATYNCVSFIQDIARYMGLRVPNNHFLYPEDWVNRLRDLNGGGKTGKMPGMEIAARKPPAPAPGPASAPALEQTASAWTRPTAIQRPYD